MLPSFLKTFFLLVVLFATTLKGEANFFCRNALAHIKGKGLSIAANRVAGIANNGKYSRSILRVAGENEFSLLVDGLPIGNGAFGVVFPIKIEGSLEAAQRALGFEEGEELVVKFPHNTYFRTLNEVTNASIVDEWKTETEFFKFCDKYKMYPHPALEPTVLHASLDGEKPFLIKKRVKKDNLVKFEGSRRLSPDQQSRLEDLFNYVVFLQKESERLTGQRISLDIKPDNLYWNGEDWSFYEITRTPQDNTFFTQGGFSGYLSILDGYTGN